MDEFAADAPWWWLVALAAGSGSAIAEDPIWGPVEHVADDVAAAQIGPVVNLRDGTSLALWTSRNGRLSAAVRSSDGVGWGASSGVSEPGVRVLSHTAVELPGDRVVAYWQGAADDLGVWSRTFRDGAWQPVRHLLTLDTRYVGLAVARGPDNVQGLAWTDGTLTTRIATRTGRGGWTMLPDLPTPYQFMSAMTLEAGRPAVIGASSGEVLATTYGPDGTWAQERIGPSAGFELEGPFERVDATTTRGGAIAVGWREIEPGAGLDADGTTVVSYRPAGGCVRRGAHARDRGQLRLHGDLSEGRARAGRRPHHGVFGSGVGRRERRLAHPSRR